MSYLPVDPDTGTVHRFAHPEHPSDERTVCGAPGAWVRSVMLLTGDEPACDECDPFGPQPAPVAGR